MSRTELATKEPNLLEVEALPTAPFADFAGGDEHPVLRIPFTAIIDGRSYKGAGLSLVSAFAKGLAASALEGQRRLVILKFNFGSYTVNLSTEVQIATASSGTGLVALRFLDPTGAHLPQLRYLLNAFVAGELADVGGLLTASARNELRKKNKSDTRKLSAGSLIKRTIRSAALLAASIALVAIVSKGVYDRFFVIKTDGISVVSAEGMVLRAISSGQIDFVNENAKTGEPLLAIRSTSGDVITLSKPCDCKILNLQASPGATVLAGEPLMQLSGADAKPIIRTILSPDAIQAVASGAEIRVEFGDGRVTIANASPIAPIQSGKSSDGEVTLFPQAGVTMADLGKPVVVQVVKSPSKAVKALIDGANHVVNSLTQFVTGLPIAIAGNL